MQVNELLQHLTNYAAHSPENGLAQVRFQSPEGMQLTWGISGANDARGLPGQHLLILLPDVNDRLGVKELKIT